MRRMIGFLMMVGLVIGVGCGSDDPTSSSRNLIIGTWEDQVEGQFWRFDSDG